MFQCTIVFEYVHLLSIKKDCPKRIPGREHCFKFEFGHRDATVYKSAVSQIVHSRTKLETAKPSLDEEIEKCRLLKGVRGFP
eukprot:7391083-Prymnesium_polylepis.1